ncbi:hypothetical protein [Labrenzia sp. DG1229]|uniref:hypothetical protein n=1 Tax=Labrenzia sp. DG1229 TaxID=681847 RepID=UPI00048E6C63|nr:hypothetical protein [Labrenzia sp. DG1229]
MSAKSVLIIILLIFFQGSARVLACVEPVRFEDTQEYTLYKSIEAESNSQDELFSKFAEVSELGVALFDFREFVSNSEYMTFNDIGKLRQKWIAGDSIILQHFIMNILLTETEYIVDNEYTGFLEEILTNNKKNCWIDDEEFSIKFLKHLLRSSKYFPEVPPLEETVSFLRELSRNMGDYEILQNYFDLLRLGGFNMAKQELSKWSGRNSSDEFCSGVAHCIERIRIEFEHVKEENAKVTKRKMRKLECEVNYVNSFGNSVRIELC